MKMLVACIEPAPSKKINPMWDFYTRPPKLHFQLKRHPDTGEMAILARWSDGQKEDSAFWSVDNFLQAHFVNARVIEEVKRYLSGLPPNAPLDLSNSFDIPFDPLTVDTEDNID